MKEVITFLVADREYGIEISGIQSLENNLEIVPVPEAPSCVLGSIMIRDEAYPVFDIRARLHLPDAGVRDENKILLLRTHIGGLACVVDSVGKVFCVDGVDIQPFPQVAMSKGTDCIDFIARKDNKLIVVINPDTLLSEEEAEMIRKIDFSKREEQE